MDQRRKRGKGCERIRRRDESVQEIVMQIVEGTGRGVHCLYTAMREACSTKFGDLPPSFFPFPDHSTRHVTRHSHVRHASTTRLLPPGCDQNIRRTSPEPHRLSMPVREDSCRHHRPRLLSSIAAKGALDAQTQRHTFLAHLPLSRLDQLSPASRRSL